MSFAPIPVDLEVYKALESRRLSFDEPHNAILRRVLGLTRGPEQGSRQNGPAEKERPLRASGHYTLTLLGEDIKIRSLREALSETLVRLEIHRPGFLDKLSQRLTPKGRRIVAHRPEDVYPNGPQLVHFAARLSPDSSWFFDTNISRRACERYLVTIGLVADIETPQLK